MATEPCWASLSDRLRPATPLPMTTKSTGFIGMAAPARVWILEARLHSSRDGRRYSYLGNRRHFCPSKAQDAAEGNGNPFRTVIEFISKFIQGFKNQKAAEQKSQVLLILRDKGSVSDFVQVS